MEIVIGENSFVAVEYEQSMGKLNEEYVKTLKAYSIDKQIENLYIENNDCEYESNYGREFDRESNYTTPLDKMEINSVIVLENVIVGLNVVCYREDFTILMNEKVTTYSASEDDGPYSRSVYDHITLKSKLLEK